MLEVLLLVSALSLDAFVASIAYGTNKIIIPFSSLFVINSVCSTFLAISLLLGSILKKFIPDRATLIISFVILFLLGIYYLFESLIKTYLRKHTNSNKKVTVKLSDIQFVLDIYLDETKADINKSKILSYKEAFYLAVALSLDSLAVGFAGSLADINYLLVILCSFICGILAILLGTFIGRKLVEKININLSWLSGILLIALAFKRLL